MEYDVDAVVVIVGEEDVPVDHVAVDEPETVSVDVAVGLTDGDNVDEVSEERYVDGDTDADPDVVELRLGVGVGDIPISISHRKPSAKPAAAVDSPENFDVGWPLVTAIMASGFAVLHMNNPQNSRPRVHIEPGNIL